MLKTGEPLPKKQCLSFSAQPDVGGKYEVAVATLVAANLAINPRVENYYIFTNLEEAHPFDDVIAKVFFKGENIPYVFAIQVKHVNKGEKNLDVGKYLKGYNRIFTCGGFEGMRDVPIDNIHFCYFCIKKPQKIMGYTPKVLNSDSNSWKSAVLFQNSYVLLCNTATNETTKRFLENFYLYLDQPDLSNLEEEIKKTCKICDVTDISKYVDRFFTIDVLQQRGLCKEVFESELLRIRLSDNMVPLTNIIQLNDIPVVIWNQLILLHNITIVEADINIERVLYGCLAQMLNYLFNVCIDWNHCKAHNLDPTLINEFEKLFTTRETIRVRHWIYPPSTLKSLLVELWKCGEVPLILKTEEELSALKEYAHLNKSYVVVTDDLVSRRNEVAKLPLRIFTHMSDIKHVKWLEMRNKLLEAIAISLHGRKPITLYSILNCHEELSTTLSCLLVLHLMKSRKAYLSKNCLEFDHNIIFLIEDPTSTDEYNIESINTIGGNTAIRCRTSDEISTFRKKIAEHQKLQTYIVCHCAVSAETENFKLIEGNKSALQDFFVDQYGESIYNLDDALVPIVGNNFRSIQENYIPRFIRSAVISKSLFDSNTKGICFFSGNLSGLDVTIRKHIKKVPLDSINGSMQASNRNIFINVENSDIDKYWRTVSNLKCPLLHICVEGTDIKLCKYKDWKGLQDHISYGTTYISEENFLTQIVDGITVLTGEPGIGKTSLLRSLFQNHGKDNYILFYNLVDYKVKQKNKVLQPNFSLDFIFNEFKTKRYGEFFSNLLKKRDRLVVLLDSFDEVLPSHKEETLNFIRNLAASNVKIIIASRLLANYILIDAFEVQFFKVDSLRGEDRKKYIKNCTFNEDAPTTIPSEFLGNPLYLNFLKTISENNIPLAHITKLALFESIINIKLNQYFDRCFSTDLLSDKEYYLEPVRELHYKLALVRILGVDVVEKQFQWKYNKDLSSQLKLGIIMSTDEEGYPTFVHETFAEYLTADWIVRNIQKDSAKKDSIKNIYQQIVDQDKLYVLDILCEHLELHRAVVEQNVVQLEIYASNRSLLEKTDSLGRTPLNVAAGHYQLTNKDTIGIIIKNMHKFKISLNESDSLMQWNWIQHLNRGNIVHSIPCDTFSILVMKEYLNGIIQKLCDGVMKCHNGDDLANAMYRTYVIAMEACAMEFSIDVIRDVWFIEDAISNGVSKAILHRECQTLEADALNLEKIRGFTPLHVATVNGNEEAVRGLTNLKHEINATDYFGCTPLHYSVISSPGVRTAITQILLENGSKVDILNRDGENAITIAVRSGVLDIAELLLERRASINNIEKIMQKPLFLSLEQGNRDMINLLFKYGADANCIDKDYTSALQFLSYLKNTDLELVKLLLNKGANVNYEDKNDRTALIIAAQRGNLDLVKLLIEHGANVNSITKKGNTSLTIAVKIDNLEVVKFLLEKGANVNSRTTEGMTPLMFAFERGNLDVIRLLLRKGGNVDSETRDGKTLLMFASQSENEDVVKLVVEKYAKINSITSDGKTSLMFASEKGDANIVRLLLEKGANINDTTTEAKTALMYASENGNPDVIRLLLERDLNINSTTTKGQTALMFASENGNLDAVQLLLEKGANINSATTKGETALMLTIQWYRSEVVKLLIENGANVNSTTTEGKTPLMFACGGNSFIAELLLEKGANINSTTRNGETALIFASIFSNKFVLKVLLEKGANVNSATTSGETSLIFAVNWGNSDVVELLLQHDADVNCTTANGESPLTLASKLGNKDVVKLLLEKGANINLISAAGETPLTLASQNGNPDVVKLLLEDGANLNSTRADGRTPLMLATDSSNSEVVKLLLENGAIVDCRTTEGITPLMLSTKLHYPYIVNLLLDKNADTNSKTAEGKTPLMFASEKGNSPVVALLIERGSKINSATIEGKTSLMFASEFGNLYVVKLLLAANAHINNATTEGKTPLMFACEKGNSQVVKLLLQKGANINTTTVEGKTPLMFASENGNSDVVELLLKEMQQLKT